MSSMEKASASTYSTPSRPMTREQFDSLRQKVVKESPRLYKNKILSDPAQSSGRPKSAPATPKHQRPLKADFRSVRGHNVAAFFKPSIKKNDDLDETDMIAENDQKNTSRSPDRPLEGHCIAELGNFENPVLGKLARRTVNKELETQIIVTNLIVLATWDLFVKFFRIFLDYSHVGKRLTDFFRERLWKLQMGIWIYKLNRSYPIIMNKLSWSNLDTVFHLIVAYNVMASLWRLFSRLKIDDLNLNRSQRELLGLEPSDEKTDAARRPHVILDQGQSFSRIDKNNEMTQSVPATPFLFKSLETPLKAKRREEQQQQQQQQQQNHHQIDLQRQAQRAFVSKVNAFGTNFARVDSIPSRSAPLATTSAGPAGPAGPAAGYIPSSKYAYMMSSPSPRKRM